MGAFVLLGLVLARPAKAQVVYTWTDSSGGAWETASNWSPALVPDSTFAYVEFTSAGTYTVTLNTSETIWGIDLANAGTTLSLGNIYLTLEPPDVASSSLTAGTLVLSNTDIQDASTYAYTFSNGATINSTGNSGIYGTTSAGLHFTNTGTVNVTSGTLLLGNGSADEVTNSSGGTMTVSGSGVLKFNGGSGSIVNSGTLTASSGGTIDFGGSFTTADLGGTIHGTGGTLNITGTLNNTSATLNAPTGGGVYTLSGGLINGGSIASGALAIGSSTGVLQSTTLNGSLSVGSGDNFGAEGVTLTGGTISFADSYIYLDGSNGSTALTVASGETLTGDVTIQGSAVDIRVANSGTITNASGSNSIYSTQGVVLDNLSGGVVSATGGTFYLGNVASDIIENESGGTINAAGGTLLLGYGGGTVSNAGLLEATAASGSLTLDGSWTNTGTIKATNGGTVNLGGSFTNSNLTSGTINGTGGTINIVGTLTNTTLAAPNGGGVFTLDGGTIVGGTVPSGTLVFGTSNGYLNGATLSGNFNQASGINFSVGNNATFTGGTVSFGDGFLYLEGSSSTTALTIASSETVSGDVTIQGGVANLTLVNNGTITNTSGSNSIYSTQTGFVLNNSSGALISASSGTLYLGNGTNDTINNAAGATINAAGGTILVGYGGATVNNAGTIEATSASSTLTIGANTFGNWTNTGTILASNGGTIDLAGTFSNSTLTSGTINGTGGTINIIGTLNNTILAAPNGGGVFTLYGGTIAGGTVPTGTLVFGGSAGTLNDVTLTGNNTVASGNSFHVENGTTFSGGTLTMVDGYIYLNGTSGSTALTIAAGETVTGNASFQAGVTNLTLVNDGTITNSSGSNSIYSTQAGFVLNNSSGGQISDSGGTLYLGNGSNDTINNAAGAIINANGGNINAGYGGAQFNNSGTIEATVTGSIVTLGYNGYANWTNTGTIETTNGGTVDFGGNFTTANLTSGTILGSGGNLYITGSLNNTSGPLVAPNSGIYTLYGGTITGGTVDSGALTFSSSGGYLSGVTMTGNVAFPATSADVNVESGTIFSGGTTTFATSSNLATIYLPAAGTDLTLAVGEIWTGSFYVQGNAAGSAMVNNGTIDFTANANGIYSNSNGMTFTNNSVINVTGAGTTASLSYYGGDVFTNAIDGTVTVNAGTLNLGTYQGNWVNTGTLRATNGGTINFGGIYTTADFGGAIYGAAGTLNLVGTFTNTGSTFSPPDSGIYTLHGATITGGTVASGALTFSGGGGTLSGVTMNGNFAAPSSSNYFVATNGTTFTGGTTSFATGSDYATVDLNGSGTDLTLAAGETWTGSFYVQGNTAGSAMVNNGTIDFTANTNGIYSNSNGMTFTNNSVINVTGAGTTASLSYYSGDVFTNATGGTVTVNAGILNLGTYQGTWVNTGSLTATNGGTINFGGSYSTPDFGGSISGSAGTLNLLGTFTNTGYTFNLPASGIYTLHGATVTGGTIASGAITFSSSGGTLSGVTMNGNFAAPSSSNYFVATNGTTFTGGTTSFATASDYATVDLNGSGTDLTVAAGETWTGSFYVQGNTAGSAMVNNGTIDFTANTNGIYSNSNGMTFTNNSVINVTGAGTSASLSYYSGDVFNNAPGGTITVNAGTLNLGTYQGGWSNSGTITATNGGTVNFGGIYTNADFAGTINGAAGTLNLAGTFTNTGSDFSAPATGIYTLHGATVTGGTISSNAVTFSSAGGTLSGVTMNGNFAAPSSSNYFVATNGTTFTNGTTTFAPGANYATIDLSGSGTDLTLASGEIWTGSFSVQGNTAGSVMVNNGTINFTANNNYIDSNSNGMTFTNNGAINVTNAGTNASLAYYSADTFTNAAAGTITVNAGTLNLGTYQGAWNNAGALTATNGGTINFGGVYNTADFGGTINGAGGTLNLLGTFTNTGSTLAAPASGLYTLAGAAVAGGTIASGALTFSNSGGTLAGVTLSGSFALPTASSAYFYVTNGTTFTGGTTSFATSNNFDTVNVSGSGTDLTLAASAIWTGSFNLIAQTTGAAISNLGMIHLTGNNNYFYANSGTLTFTNGGTILATGGSLYLGESANDTYTEAAAADLEASGATITVGYGGGTATNLTGNTLSGGTWDAAGGGTIDFYGTTNAIVTNNATLILDGAGSNIQTRTGSAGSYQTVDTTLVTNNGSLEVLTNRNFTGANAFTNNGSLVLGGGTFTESSFASGSGSSVAGTGSVAVTAGAFTIGTGVTVSPGASTAGNYVGTLGLNASSGTVLASGGTVVFDVENAGGAAGTGYDTLAATGSANITATTGTFTIDLRSVNPGTGLPGLATFTNTSTYQWTLLSSTALTNFNASDFVINTSGFSNSLGIGSFYVSSNGSDLFVDFTPVPEPSTWALIGGGVAAFGGLAWRRRARRAP